MKVNSPRDIPFKSIYTNKTFKKGLEFAADNGALFGASAAVIFSIARPVSIWLTPKTEKENRKLAITKSLSSSLISFLLTLGISIPLAKSIKNIDKNPEKYLRQESIDILKDKSKDLYESKGYEFATQLFKLGIGAIIAVPKSILTADGMAMFTKKSEQKNNNNSLTFKGNSTNQISSGIGKIINKKWFLEFANKYKDSNFPMHIVALTDIISTAAFIKRLNNSKRTEKNRKKILAYNSGISTALSIGCGYILDKLLDKPTQNFMNKYAQINKSDKNLQKQLQGIKIAKPFIILGTVYYIFIPFISTFLAEQANDCMTKTH